MPVPTSISDLTTIASTNSPAGTESVKGTIDDYLRAHGAFIRQLADVVAGSTVVLASAATVAIGFAASNNVAITGTTTITAFDNAAEGTLRWVVFAGALTLTHNASTLILPAAANLGTSAGDVAVFKSLGGGSWKCMHYLRINGAGPVASSATRDGYLSATDWALFNNKQATGVCLPLTGGALTGPLALANSTALQFKDTGGTARSFAGLGSDNFLNMYVAGGNAVRWFNQAGTTILLTIDNTGIVTPTNNLVFPQNVGIFFNDTGGAPRQFAKLQGADVNFTIAGGGNFNFFNQAGTTVVASLTNAGLFTAVSVAQTSDERKKRAWQHLPKDFVAQLASIKKSGLFTWRKGGHAGVGVGAQSLERILPVAVHTDSKGAKTVEYGPAAMVSAIELARALVAMEARLTALEAK